MPTFPIYAGSSRFQALEKRNPDIPIGIAKILLNPDFLKISPVLQQLTLNFELDFIIPRHFSMASQSESRNRSAITVYMCRMECMCRESVSL